MESSTPHLEEVEIVVEDHPPLPPPPPPTSTPPTLPPPPPPPPPPSSVPPPGETQQPSNEVPSYKPYVGMEFESDDQAFQFYNEYATIVGFSIRKDNVRKSTVDGSCFFRKLCCSKQGYPRRLVRERAKLKKKTEAMTEVWKKVEETKASPPRLSRRAVAEKKIREEVFQRHRVGCNAKLDVRKLSEGKWVVTKFVEEHNHECVCLGDPNMIRSLIANQESNGLEALENGSPDDLKMVAELNSLKPAVGMEFESHHMAFLFYNTYARVTGFIVRKDKTRRSCIDGSLLFRKFCCSKEGYRKKSKNSANGTTDQAQINGDTAAATNKRSRVPPVTRVGCNAKLDVKKMPDGKWLVESFVEEHNHELEPLREKHLFVSPKLIQSTQTQALADASDGEKKWKNEIVPKREAVGSQKVFYEGPLFRNRYYKKKKKQLEKGDAENIFNYLRQMQSEDPSFFYATEVDEEDQLLSCFWADSRSRMDFCYFGDVVYFKTSYGISQYGPPFAPLVGVNHHLQTVVFGCAILLSETSESFTWLLETLLKAMHGHRPVAIITDQDQEMAKAIERVLPGTYHCLSLWHIFQNTEKNLNYLHNDEENFSLYFERCIYESHSSEDFESSWEALLDQYELHEDEWIQNIYSKRHKWVPIFLKHIFQADMMTTQRTESIHSFFGDGLNKYLCFDEFIKKYEKALIDSREKEAHEDFESNETSRVLKSELPLEKQAADDYTRLMFNEFQKEFSESFNYTAKETKTETVETNQSFVVSREGEIRNYVVSFSKSDDEVHTSCSCQYFEFMGILCKHILKVFTTTNTSLIPKIYLKKRWTKRAKVGVVLADNRKEKPADCQNPLARRYTDLCQLALNISAKAAASLKAYQNVKSDISATLCELEKDGEEEPNYTQPDIDGTKNPARRDRVHKKKKRKYTKRRTEPVQEEADGEEAENNDDFLNDLLNLYPDVSLYANPTGAPDAANLAVNSAPHPFPAPPNMWILPPAGWIKLNFGGFSKEFFYGYDSRIVAGFGGTISISDGSIIKAYAGPAGEVEETDAELLGLWNGIKILDALPASKVWIEGDSEMIIKWLKKESDVPWSFTPVFFEIESMIAAKLDVGRVSHINKEGNHMVDKLALEGSTKDALIIYDQLPIL